MEVDTVLSKELINVGVWFLGIASTIFVVWRNIRGLSKDIKEDLMQRAVWQKGVDDSLDQIKSEYQEIKNGVVGGAEKIEKIMEWKSTTEFILREHDNKISKVFNILDEIRDKK